MKITLEIDNDYEDGVSITTHVEADVPHPRNQDYDLTDEDQLQEWAGENLQEHTGTGRYAGNDEGLERTPDAVYTVKVTACPGEPKLVGRTFEFGL